MVSMRNNASEGGDNMQSQCGKPMRYGPCEMKQGHRGRHTTVAFYCDGCGKTRRGQPHREYREEGVAFCFMCYLDQPQYR